MGELRLPKRPHPTEGQGAWDEGNVREASEVRAQARQNGKAIHFGWNFELRHEEGSELADGDPEHKNERASRFDRG